MNFKVKISFLIHSFLAQFLSLFFPRNLDLVAATLRFKGTCIKESHESDVQKKNFDHSISKESFNRVSYRDAY